MKIVDIFNTRYFISHWSKDVGEFINALETGESLAYYQSSLDIMRANNDKILDIADAKIVQEVLDVLINNLNADITVIDSKDAFRERFLRERERRRNNPYAKVPLPTFKAGININTFFKDLNKEAVYTIDKTYFKLTQDELTRVANLNVAMCVLASLWYPDLKIHLGDCTEDYFRHVNRYMDLEDNIYKDYLVLWNTTNYVSARTLPNGDIDVDWYGVYTWEEFKNEHIYIPSFIGTRKAEDSELKGIFENVIRETLPIVSKVRTGNQTLLDLVKTS